MSHLERVRYDERAEQGPLDHFDERRDIYDAPTISDWAGEGWHAQGVIYLRNPSLQLGNHHHDFDEMYFTPNGDFDVWLSDAENPREGKHFTMSTGSRLFIPAYVTHRVQGTKGAILLTFGEIPFDDSRILPSSPEALEALDRI